jgi:hypothetical protein
MFARVLALVTALISGFVVVLVVRRRELLDRGADAA